MGEAFLQHGRYEGLPEYHNILPRCVHAGLLKFLRRLRLYDFLLSIPVRQKNVHLRLKTELPQVSLQSWLSQGPHLQYLFQQHSLPE